MSIESEPEEWHNTDGTSVSIVKDADVEVSDAELRQAFLGSNNTLLREMSSWVNSVSIAGNTTRNRTRRTSGLFERDRYVTPEGIFDQFKVAREAAENDDIVSNILESTEALVFNRIKIECDDEDEENIWNQIVRDMGLDRHFREMWRDLFVYSQYYVASFWSNKEYKVEGRGEKRARRKTYKLNVPTRLSMLDPMKVLPVGEFLFGGEQLVYVANRGEAGNIDDVIAGKNTTDQVVSNLLTGKYETDREERMRLAEMVGTNVDLTHLYSLNPALVWRHTATRPSYTRFAPVRMNSVFELLDLKHQLRQMDRAHLLGAPLRTDQRVVTPNGWVEIGDIEVGDQVYGPDGKPVDVVGVYPQGVLPMKKVTFSDGAVVYCDKTHLWTVETRSGRRRTMPLWEILEEGLWDSNGEDKRVARHRVPVTKPVELPTQDVPLDPYLVGYLLGDGSLDQSTVKITSAEEDYPWMDCLPEGVKTSQYEKREGYALQFGLVTEDWQDNVVINALEELGLRGLTCRNKHIPEIYLWGDVWQRWSLLQGLLDSDGSAHASGGAEFCTISEGLAEGIIQLVRSLGGNITKIVIPEHDNKAELYRIYISFDQFGAGLNMQVPFRLKRKKEEYSPRKTAVIRSIVNVEDSVDAEAVCIKVDDSDGLFLTEGFVTTHNTNFIVLVKKGSDSQPATSTEIANLSNSVKTVARTPLIVGDHRLSIEIITPKIDVTLDPKRYNALDSRITARLFQIFHLGGFSAGSAGDDSLKLTRIIARGLESRRQMIKENFERNLLVPAFEANPSLKSRPSVQFTPRSVALDFDPNFLQTVMDLYFDGSVSRETILGVVDLDQSKEAFRREIEKEEYDDIMEPRMKGPGGLGALTGGNSNGGGKNADSNKPNPTPRRPSGDVPGDKE